MPAGSWMLSDKFLTIGTPHGWMLAYEMVSDKLLTIGIPHGCLLAQTNKHKRYKSPLRP